MNEPENQYDDGTEFEAEGGSLPSLKIVAGCLLLVALVLALGMTGGQVRQLSSRLDTVESERAGFERRLSSLREDNSGLLVRMRDYQEVLEVAQNANVTLSKRLEKRDMDVADLQTSLDAILKEKYATENQLREQIDGLENEKRDLNAQVAALGEAVTAQSKEIAQLDQTYRGAEKQAAAASSEKDRLLAENDRYLNMMSQMQDRFELMEENNRGLVERFNALQSQADIIQAEKLAIQRELESIQDNNNSEPFGANEVDPFEGYDPFAPPSADQNLENEQESSTLASSNNQSA